MCKSDFIEAINILVNVNKLIHVNMLIQNNVRNNAVQ